MVSKKSTPEELLQKAVEKARKAGLHVHASSSRVDEEDGHTIEKEY